MAPRWVAEPPPSKDCPSLMVAPTRPAEWFIWMVGGDDDDDDDDDDDPVHSCH